MKNDYKKLGKIIKDIRESKGLSQRKLAKIINISNAELSKIESGERQIPNLVTLISVCELLNINFTELLKETGFLGYKGCKVYEFTVQKVLSKKIKINAKSEEEAMDLINDFILDNDIEELDPDEHYCLEADKIADDDKEFLKEGQRLLSEEYDEENNEVEDDFDDLKECNSCEYYCPICGECTYDE